MIKEFLPLGQVVGTHGVKGELRINPWCDSPAFAKQFKTVYLNEKGQNGVKVLSCRPHGNIILLMLEGVGSINEAEKLRSAVLYIKRADAKLAPGTWFIEELLGCEVFDADTPDKRYGVLTDVSSTGANDVWYITDENGREYLIPAIKSVVIDTRVEENRVFIRPLRGIFDPAEEINDED